MICQRRLLVSMMVLALSVFGSENLSARQPSQSKIEHKHFDFGIYWPPKDPSEIPATADKALLQGRLNVRVEPSPDEGLAMHLRIILTRPSDEAARAFWNSRLAFPEYDWMRYVRVWDTDNRWLWPNLPYLLRLHGTERVERYGGVDPGKGVDNDFAAVLIRKYDASGLAESADTTNAPLVAADWYPVDAAAASKQTIIHTAQSDEFTLHTGPTQKASPGTAVIWLVYADFMGAKLPGTWPKTPEYAGGILACFELKWDLKTSPGREITVHQITPRQATGFDWELWATATRLRHGSTSAKLSDPITVN